MCVKKRFETRFDEEKRKRKKDFLKLGGIGLYLYDSHGDSIMFYEILDDLLKNNKAGNPWKPREGWNV